MARITFNNNLMARNYIFVGGGGGNNLMARITFLLGVGGGVALLSLSS